MKKLGLNEIREKFLSYFESKNHMRLKSASLVPRDDKSILLINSGMAPLKAYFSGQEVPPNNRAVSCQKCIRTPDIERVGKTERHGTFFEMLGNFSFGDYFKEEATAWAWEFCTKILELPVDRLWVSIYLDDDEAFDIWTKKVGVSEDRIVRMGKEDNFWEIGLGPCGPSSEIYFDRGVERSCGHKDCKLGCECDRYIEFWNLVFTQYDKDETGNYNRLSNPNIDTGMGLERIAAIMQEVNNIFEVDTIKYILDYICKLTGVKYGKNKEKDVSIRVITDHIRGVTFMTSDGILPSNEGRGYILRRLLRRAARHGKLLGLNEKFLCKLAMKVIEVSGDAYPELVDKQDYILNVIGIEEKRFDETIDQGLAILQGYIDELKSLGLDTLSGENSFRLYDTYGFPLDLTKDVLEEQGYKVDEKGFQCEMEAQRQRARAVRSDSDIVGWKDDIYSKIDWNIKTEFVGHNKYEEEAIIKIIIADGKIVDSVNNNKELSIILDKTPFYAESGGQIADTGTIVSKDFELEVVDVKKVAGDRFIHVSKLVSGTVKVNSSCLAKIDAHKRLAVSRNHSTTHLLHKALRNVLGNHVEQAGSLVTSDRLRFDFSHFKSMSQEEIDSVEKEVNDMILSSLDVITCVASIDEAKKMGAMALFGEKYGDTVRVVKMGKFSVELCGGTHLKTTSQAGLFKIVSENGIAAGVRRIEALTGEKAYQHIKEEEEILAQLNQKLKSMPKECNKKLDALICQLKETEKELNALKSKMATSEMDDIINNVKEIKGVKYLTAVVKDMAVGELRSIGDKLKDKLQNCVLVLVTECGEKISIISMASKEAVKQGVHAGKLIKEVCKIAGGSGGGRPDMAQGGLKDISKTDEALNQVGKILEEQIK